MHIRRLRIQNIRSITNLNVEIPDPRAGWHVILGDNGSGKSSVIRAMALALMGPLDATATRQNWQDWIRKTASRARVELEVAPDAEFDKWKRTGRRAQKPITVTVTFPTAGAGANSAAPDIAGRFAARTIWGGGTGEAPAGSPHRSGPFAAFPEARLGAPPLHLRRRRGPRRSIEMVTGPPRPSGPIARDFMSM